MTNADIDPRPLYSDALDWVSGLVAGVGDDQFDRPTPCPEFDVATLIGHQLAGLRRAATMAHGGDATTVPLVLAYTGDPAEEYAAEARATLRAWDDDSKLESMVTAPWGTVPGRAAVWAYLNETLVHGWDLAVATNQPFEADPNLVTPMLQVATSAIPDEGREYMPFGEVVPPRRGAAVTERLANWSGRSSEPWVSAPLH